MDISKFFDEIDHELMIKAVEHVMEEKWVKMYVERWLRMPVKKQDGTLQPKAGKGTPQGGVISPLLANLYLHFTLDVWLSRHYPEVNFVRYADDVVVHCTSKAEAEKVLEAIKRRLEEVKLQIKEEKTRIAYCRDYRRKARHDVVKFEFLGFSYQPRARKSKRDGKCFTAFAAEISQTNQKRIRTVIREVKIWRNTEVEMTCVAKLLNAKLRGWIAYYGRYSTRSLRNTLMMIDRKLIKWIKKKHKIGYRKAVTKLNTIRQANPALFYHWKMGYC
jgi:group II intron reverse transcriptase/maturase